MSAPETPEEAIEQNVLGPKSVTADGTTVVQHSIDDQIKADQYLAAKTAASKDKLGLMFRKLIPPGGG